MEKQIDGRELNEELKYSQGVRSHKRKPKETREGISNEETNKKKGNMYWKKVLKNQVIKELER